MSEVPGQIALEAEDLSGLRGAVRRAAKASYRALRHNPNMALGFFLILTMLAIALAAPLIATHDPTRLRINERLVSPSAAHRFGTDQLGRDVFSRVIYGARVSLLVGGMVATLAATMGIVLGLTAGYFRGVDNVLMRFMDALLAFPSFLLAIALVSAWGSGVWTVILAIALVNTPYATRLARAAVLTLRDVDFVDAARAIGARPLRIMLVHILPNSLAPILVQATFIFAVSILIEAGLSFLGVGVPPEVPTWGNTMGEGRRSVQVAIWILFFPGLFLSLTVLGINLVGDGLRDALDPKLRGKL